MARPFHPARDETYSAAEPLDTRMDARRTLLVDAFTQEPLTGNAAGVVPDADGLSERQMQAVARELGASETAFLLPSDSADRRVRYFTPTTEVDLCGHATIASHAHLHDDHVIEDGEHTLETNVGVLDIVVEPGGRVWMSQDDPVVRTVDVEPDRVADALGIDETALDVDGLPLAYATTGLPFLVVPVRLLSDLGGAEPDMEAVDAIAESIDAVGLYAFTFDALEGDSTLHGRMWAPGAGVPEDPVTGTASGAVGAYLRRFDAFDTMPEAMVFEQGHFVDRPGRVFVAIGEAVKVGGYAATVLDGELSVPDVDDGEDIIEV